LAKSVQWLKENPKYQTKGFKKKWASFSVKKRTYKLEPKDGEEKEEGVVYMKHQHEVDYGNEEDNVVNDEKFNIALTDIL